MEPIDIGEMIAMWMVMFGDILTIIAISGSLFLLLGVLMKSRKLAFDSGSAAFLALIVAIYGFMNKITDPGMADFTNGFMLKFSDEMVAVLLTISVMLLIGSIGLIVFRRLVMK